MEEEIKCRLGQTRTGIRQLHSVISVSYTHLDVYKRQVFKSLLKPIKQNEP